MPLSHAEERNSTDTYPQFTDDDDDGVTDCIADRVKVLTERFRVRSTHYVNPD